MSVVIVGDDPGTIVRHVQADVPTEGSGSFTWDGHADATTAIVPDGVYHYGITAESLTGDVTTASGSIGVDTRPIAHFSRPAADETVTGQSPPVVDIDGRLPR